VATAPNVDPAPVLAYAGSSIRRLYVEGLCGGAIVPMAALYGPHHDMHVPVAHQSALAGILLGATLMARCSGQEPNQSRVSRLDLRRALGKFITQPVAPDPRGICVCEDDVFQTAYRRKFSKPT
jgi:hypothetical protein